MISKQCASFDYLSCHLHLEKQYFISTLNSMIPTESGSEQNPSIRRKLEAVRDRYSNPSKRDESEVAKRV